MERVICFPCFVNNFNIDTIFQLFCQQAQVTQSQQQQDELQSVLMRRRENTSRAMDAQKSPQPEFQSRFSHLRRDD
eukprot:m.126530 g.126530  ORF g.126530 m.126530 type:complete len:76 (-) comp12994_c4_seq1:133-360(-)